MMDTCFDKREKVPLWECNVTVTTRVRENDKGKIVGD